ncbi:MAG: protein kinase, partial [Planctomycetota bacterium]
MAPTLPTIEGYDVLDFLGEGRMGLVYKATNKQNRQIVALKVLKEELNSDVKKLVRFKKEGDILVKLKHKNIISASDSNEKNGLHYYAMEVVLGKDLKEKCDEIRGPLEPKWAMYYCYQAAAALQYLNFNKVVHRDLKPANIMIGYDHCVKVCDLSFARTDEYDDLLSKEGCTVGTPNYMSPELARAEDKIDIQTDIYSLGASIYYTLVNASPFTGATPQEVMTKHCEEPLVPPHVRNPKVPKPISDIICKMMAKTREERYLDPVALLRDIRTVVNIKEMEDNAKNNKQTMCPNCSTLNSAQTQECINCFHDLLPMQSVGLKLFEDEMNCPLCNGVMNTSENGCPHCGVLVCPGCSDAVMPGEDSCQSCGAKLALINSLPPATSAAEGGAGKSKSGGDKKKSGGDKSGKPSGKEKGETKESAGKDGGVVLDSGKVVMILGAVVFLIVLWIGYSQFFNDGPPKKNNISQKNTDPKNTDPKNTNVKDPVTGDEKLIQQIPALDERLKAMKATVAAGNAKVDQELKELEEMFSQSRDQLTEEAQQEYENNIKELKDQALAKQQAIKNQPTPAELAQQVFREGEKAFREGKLEEARQQMEATLKHDPQTKRAYELLIQIASIQKNSRELVLRLKTLKQQFPLDSRQELLLADTLFDLKNYEEAYASYQNAKITIQDKQRGAQVLQCLLETKKLNELVTAYKELSSDRQDGKIYQAKILRLAEENKMNEVFLEQLPNLIQKDASYYDLSYYRLLRESINGTLGGTKIDRVTLKDGTMIEGHIVNEQAQYITFKDEDGKQSLLYSKDLNKVEKEVLPSLDQKLVQYLELRKSGNLEKVLDFCLAQPEPEFQKYAVSASILLLGNQPDHPGATAALSKLNYLKVVDGYIPSTAKDFQDVIEKLKKNDLKGSIPLLDNILKSNPNHFESNFLKAIVFFDDKDYRKASSALKKLQKLFKGTPFA